MNDTRPTMIRPYIEDARLGDGFRTAFVLRDKPSRAVLFVPSLLATAEVPAESARNAKVIAYRPLVIRHHMLARARMMRTHGHRFPRAATVEVLRRLGAGRASIAEAVQAAPSPEVVAARERRSSRAERAEHEREVEAAIRDRMAFAARHPRPETPARPIPAPRRRRFDPHPDQFALAL